jgi:hypothetical protein
LIDALDSHDRKNALKYAKVLMLKAFSADAWLTLLKPFHFLYIMRYIPQSQYTFEEICEQCHNAINRPVSDTQELKVRYSDVQEWFAKWNELSVR